MAGKSGFEEYARLIWPPEIGVSYCFTIQNSSDLPAITRAFGSDVVADNDVLLYANQMPFDEFGLFLASQTQGFVPFVDLARGITAMVKRDDFKRDDLFQNWLKSGGPMAEPNCRGTE